MALEKRCLGFIAIFVFYNSLLTSNQQRNIWNERLLIVQEFDHRHFYIAYSRCTRGVEKESVLST